MKNEPIAGQFFCSANPRKRIVQILRSAGDYLINRVEDFTQQLYRG